MQDIAAIEKSLHGIAAAFKEGGLYFVIGAALFVIYKIAVLISKRQRQASQEVNVTIPPAPGTNGNGHTPELIRGHESRISKVETGIDNLAKDIATNRKENREDHQQIFNAIGELKKA